MHSPLAVALTNTVRREKYAQPATTETRYENVHYRTHVALPKLCKNKIHTISPSHQPISNQNCFDMLWEDIVYKPMILNALNFSSAVLFLMKISIKNLGSRHIVEKALAGCWLLHTYIKTQQDRHKYRHIAYSEIQVARLLVGMYCCVRSGARSRSGNCIVVQKWVFLGQNTLCSPMTEN